MRSEGAWFLRLHGARDHLLRAPLVSLLAILACDSRVPELSTVSYRPAAALPAEPRPPRLDEIPESMRPCYSCHPSEVASYLQHGMARSIGAVGRPTTGSVTNPRNGNSYEIAVDSNGAVLTARASDGGARKQRLVGRIGAGIFDTSWVAAEIDPFDGSVSDRLFFAPVETITGHGLELAPFELNERSPGVDMALTNECLTCHTVDRLSRLPSAAAGDGYIFPPNHLGHDAFETLSAITCDGCHGDSTPHLDRMARGGEGTEDIGLERLADLAPGEQRDVCARCHLQGDARIDLVGGQPRKDQPLAGQIAVLVPRHSGEGFRFVSQTERLVLSSCFRNSPEMTCTSCHRPHTSVARQGFASLETACGGCHELCRRPASLSVPEVTGEAARSENGCVDCHMRRSQPFDLPHVRSVDHFIRRRIARPTDGVPHRQFDDGRGDLQFFDDGRLAAALATPEGTRWLHGIEAMAMVTMLRVPEAAARLAVFPEPGTAAAVRPTAPAGLVPLETQPSFHQVRALVLQATGEFQRALRAYSDALELSPEFPAARLARARMSLDAGDTKTALADTDFLVARFPRSEAPWDLRAQIALRMRNPKLAVAALSESAKLWSSNPGTWMELGRQLRALGMEDEARQAFSLARVLRPSLDLPLR